MFDEAVNHLNLEVDLLPAACRIRHAVGAAVPCPDLGGGSFD